MAILSTFAFGVTVNFKRGDSHIKLLTRGDSHIKLLKRGEAT